MAAGLTHQDSAARRGEPSYVWRAGQERRLSMITAAAGDRLRGRVLDNGCGVGEYLARLAEDAREAHGVEFDLERARASRRRAGQARIVNAAGEGLPYRPESFDLVLSHEVLEHVDDDRAAAREIARVLRRGGRAIVFVPNRGYPFETHGIYWRGRYHFGNIPLIGYLPRAWRARLAPHVRAYTRPELRRLIEGLPLKVVKASIVFGAYDNIIARRPRFGRALRRLLHALESTPLRVFGLSHVWVLERV